MLSTANMRKPHDDIDHGLQNASKAIHANKSILCDKNVSVALRLEFFASVVSFATSHRQMYVGDLRKLDVRCRNLLRRVVWPPFGVNWNGPRREVLQHDCREQHLQYSDSSKSICKLCGHVAGKAMGQTGVRLAPQGW